MIRTIRAAALQLQAHDRDDFLTSLDSIVNWVSEAASAADLVVLPEATFPAYVLGEKPLEKAAIARALDRLCSVAAATHAVIVVGAADVRDGVARNAAFVIDADGSVAGHADKLFLWHFDRRWFAPGARLEPVSTAVGMLGVLICADGRLPTIARALVDRGARALVMPTAWVTSGRDPEALENVQADLLARVRAYENRVPFVAANKCGSELGMVAYCGKSQIVDASGEVVALADERRPQALHAEIALERKAPPRSSVLAHPAARPETVRRALRLGISFDPLPADIDARLELLDDDYALSPLDSARLAALDQVVPLASVTDDFVLDPAGLVGYRRAGYRLIVWTSDVTSPWLERLARARALELRLYLVVFAAASRRAFAVDPDGTIVAGTFDGYRLASFAFDAQKTAQTEVAPATDVDEGLARVAAIAAGVEPAAT
jgi:predicted amidohydrolase